MKNTLRNTLSFLFEATGPSGVVTINDKMKLNITVGEKNSASFSLKKEVEKDEKGKALPPPEPTNEDLKKIAKVTVGFLRKYKIKHATVSLGDTPQGKKGMTAIRDFFEKQENSEYTVLADNYTAVMTLDKVKKEKAPKEPKEKKPSSASKRIPSVFDETGENVGVKRVFKIEKDADGKEIKRYIKVFLKYATIKKLTHTLKRKNGGTVEIYTYQTRRDAGMLKKKLSYKERQYQADLANMEKIRTAPEKEVMGKNEDYLNLKRELRAGVMEELKKIKNQGVLVPETVSKAVKSNINLSLGKFNIETDWKNYDETKKDAIVKKTVTDIRHRFNKVFK